MRMRRNILTEESLQPALRTDNLSCGRRRRDRPVCSWGSFGQVETVVMKSFTLVIPLILSAVTLRAGDDWPQLQGDALRSGNAAGAAVKTPLGLAGAVPLTDGIYAGPVIADGKVFAMDGAGVVSAIDAQTLKPLWR